MKPVLHHALLVGALCVSIAFGQVASGSLAGQVKDESGAALAAARVVARQETTGFTRSAVSDPSGVYRIEQMAPGTYSIEVHHDGFRTAVASHVTIEVQQQATLDFSLKVGGAHDAVEVSARVSPLQTQDSAVGYRIDSDTLTQLPLEERNVISLVTLGPGAIPRQLGGFTHDEDNDQQQGTRGSVALNPPINGARPSMNSFLLDGAYDTDRNAFAIVVTPPMESVQEFRIQSSMAPAPFAQSGGGVMDVITKSGGREFHGNAFEYFRNEFTDARSYFEDPTLARPPFRRNQYGGSLGGRLPVRSTFFFVTYEGLRSKSATPSLQLVPGAAMRGGDFSQGNLIYDPLSASTAAARSPFPGNIIPADRIDPIAKAYLTLYEPLPNRPNNPSSNYLDSSPSSSNHDEVSARIDHQFTNAGLLFGRYTINEETGGIGGNFPLRPTSEQLRAQQAVLGHTIGGASWSNELRASFTRLRLFDVPINAGNINVAAQLGISNPPTDPASFGLPYFFLTDFSTVTDDPTLPQMQRDNTWDLSDTVSLVRGRHTYRFGVDWIHFQMNYRQSNSVRGQYSYTGGFTGNGDTTNTGDALADFLLGFPVQSQRTVGNSQAYLRENSASGFAEEDWQAAKDLTVTLGVRYEYTSPFTEANGNLYNLDYSNLPQPPTLVNASSAYDPNLHDFAPRVGLAWRLPGALSSHGDTVFRAGYGIYYSPEIAVESYDLALNRLTNQMNETDGKRAADPDHAEWLPDYCEHRLPQLLRTRPPPADAVRAAMERRLPARVAGRGRLRGVLYRKQRDAPGEVPALQHRAAHGDRPESGPASGRPAIAADVPHPGPDHPAGTHRQFLVQFATAQGREAFREVAQLSGQLRVVEVDRRCGQRGAEPVCQRGRAGRTQSAPGARALLLQRGPEGQRRLRVPAAESKWADASAGRGRLGVERADHDSGRYAARCALQRAGHRERRHV